MRNLKDKLYGLVAGLAIGALGVGTTYKLMDNRAKDERRELLKETAEYVLLGRKPSTPELEGIKWFKENFYVIPDAREIIFVSKADVLRDLPPHGLSLPWNYNYSVGGKNFLHEEGSPMTGPMPNNSFQEMTMPFIDTPFYTNSNSNDNE